MELKKTTLGAGSKANHLSYLGDATIGANVNVGAGTITCNYDGVNKNKPQRGEAHRLLDQRVCPDHHAELPGGQPVGQVTAASGAGRSREQLDWHRASQQAVECDQVLLGQRLGGRHQRGLAAALDGPEHRVERHHGLAGPHLPHQQPLHRALAGQVAVDLLTGARLVAGELEGKRLRPRVDELARRLKRRRPACLAARAAATGHSELEQEQLLERQPLAARGGLVLVVWEVGPGQGCCAVG